MDPQIVTTQQWSAPSYQYPQTPEHNYIATTPGGYLDQSSPTSPTPHTGFSNIYSSPNTDYSQSPYSSNWQQEPSLQSPPIASTFQLANVQTQRSGRAGSSVDAASEGSSRRELSSGERSCRLCEALTKNHYRVWYSRRQIAEIILSSRKG